MRAREPDYLPFANETGRNWLHEHVEIPMLLRMLRLPRQVRLLEVGCGAGIALPVLARRLAPLRLTGIDIDSTLLVKADKRLRELPLAHDLITADVRHLPFDTESFDLVIDFGTCFHIGRPGDALREIARVLVPRGVFVTETKLSQAIAHPERLRGQRFVSGAGAPWLMPLQNGVLWRSYRRFSV